LLGESPAEARSTAPRAAALWLAALWADTAGTISKDANKRVQSFVMA